MVKVCLWAFCKIGLGTSRAIKKGIFMKFFSALLFVQIVLLGCVIDTNPGYLNNKPDTDMLIPNTSTLWDVVAMLGEPATNKMHFRKNLTYRYYYNRPNASIDTGLMIKGNYSSGCKGCGEIVATFTWGQTDSFKDFLLTGLVVSDEHNSSVQDSGNLIP
jgi:hypothetical protein